MLDPIGKEGLRFFGAMTASISHEIKNRMAVINEQAGLLEDLVLMTRQGRDIDISRLERLAGSVKNQIQLADGIIKTMNRFAHSIDTLTCPADLNEVVSLAVRLFKRTAGNRDIELSENPSETPVSITTSPYLLMNLLWQCLGSVMEIAGRKAIVKIGAASTPEGADIRMDWEPGEGAATIPGFPDAAIPFKDALKVSAEVQNDESRMVLSLPAAI